MKKLLCIALIALMLMGIALAEGAAQTEAMPEITLESFDGIWVADTVFADDELHEMSEYDFTMLFKIENGHAAMAEEAEGYGSRYQEFDGTLEDGKLTLVNENETIVLSFNEEGTMVWDEDGIVYSFYLFEEDSEEEIAE